MSNIKKAKHTSYLPQIYTIFKKINYIWALLVITQYRDLFTTLKTLLP